MMRLFFLRFLAITLLCCSFNVLAGGPGSEAPPLLPPVPATYAPHIDLGGYYFDNTDAKGRYEPTFFLPLWQNSDHVVFGDFRYYDFSGTPYEWNAAGGFRMLLNGRQDMLGFYAGYDRKRSELNNTFNQVSFGGEYWRHLFFIGANGYIPVGTIRRNMEVVMTGVFATAPAGSGTPGSGVFGNIFFNSQTGFEQALPGFDAEMGYTVWKGLSLFAGGYYFHRSGTPTVGGPKATLEYNWYAPREHRILSLFNRLTFESEVRHDTPRGTTWYVGGRLSIDLARLHGPNLEGTAVHMVDPIRRDMDLITERGRSNNQPQAYIKNGRVANIKYVATKEGIEQAIADQQVDIIAVTGTIGDLETLNLASGRSLCITGGDYESTFQGRPFTVPDLGDDGVLVARTDTSLFNLIDGSFPVNIQHITLTINDSDLTDFNQIATIENAGGGTATGSFAQLIVNKINTNGPFRLRVGAGQSGNLSVTNSVFQTVIDNNAGPIVSELNYFPLFLFNQGTLTVDSISGNTFNIVAQNFSAHLFDLAAIAFLNQDAGALTVSQINNNNISLSIPVANSLSSDFDGNFLGISILSDGDETSQITLNSISNNQMMLSAQNIADGGRIIMSGIFTNGNNDTVVMGNINQNNITISISNYSGDIIEEGGFDFNDTAFDNLTINTIDGNIFTLIANNVSGEVGLFGVFMDNSDDTLPAMQIGSFSQNTFNASAEQVGNLDIGGFVNVAEGDGQLVINNMNSNVFNISVDAPTKFNVIAGIANENSVVTTIGNINNNQFNIVVSNATDGNNIAGLLISDNAGNISITNINNNQFNLSTDQVDLGTTGEVAGILTVEPLAEFALDNISGNQFNLAANAATSGDINLYGVRVGESGLLSTSNVNNIINNQFNLDATTSVNDSSVKEEGISFARQPLAVGPITENSISISATTTAINADLTQVGIFADNIDGNINIVGQDDLEFDNVFALSEEGQFNILAMDPVRIIPPP